MPSDNKKSGQSPVGVPGLGSETPFSIENSLEFKKAHLEQENLKNLCNFPDMQ